MQRSSRRGLGLILVLLAIVAFSSTSFAAGQNAAHQQAVARAHLQANSQRYKLKANTADLVDSAVIASPGGAHVRFQQMVGNVPVEDGIVNVGLDRANAVLLVTSGYQPNVDAVNTTPSVTADVAISTAKQTVGSAATGASTQTSLVVYAKGPALAWKITLSTDRGAWQVFVDAHNGQTLQVRDLVQSLDGKGQVFTPNPVATLQDPTLSDQNDANYPALAAAYRTVTLQGLDGSGYLRGSFVDASSKNSAKEPSLQFIYTRDDIRFEQVMTYYHIDRVQRYIQSLGFTNANNRQQRAKISTFSYDNSFYNPSTKDISYGRGGVDDAEDADVIVHEYGHAVQDNQVPGFGSSLEAGSMGEGFGDYLAFTTNSAGQTGSYLACIAEWDSTSYDNGNPPCLRRLDSTKRYPADVVGEVHADGEIWSRALFDIWTTLGKTTADRLVLQAHFYLTPTASFQDGANAIIAADRALYNGKDEARLRRIFSDRGIPTN